MTTSDPLPKYECLTEVASKIGDFEPCTFVISQVEKGICYAKAALIKPDFDGCNQVPIKQVVDMNEAHMARDNCWNYMADHGNSPELCQYIYTTSIKESCS